MWSLWPRCLYFRREEFSFDVGKCRESLRSSQRMTESAGWFNCVDRFRIVSQRFLKFCSQQQIQTWGVWITSHWCRPSRHPYTYLPLDGSVESKTALPPWLAEPCLWCFHAAAACHCPRRQWLNPRFFYFFKLNALWVIFRRITPRSGPHQLLCGASAPARPAHALTPE